MTFRKYSRLTSSSFFVCTTDVGELGLVELEVEPSSTEFLKGRPVFCKSTALCVKLLVRGDVLQYPIPGLR